MTSGLFCRTLVDGDLQPDAGALPMALAHGFTQNSQCWASFAEHLGAGGERVVAVDAPGHGESAHDEDDLAAAGERVVEAGGRAHWIGYSMGGRMLLHSALGPSVSKIASLVLIGATGGIDDEADRLARRQRDALLADRIDEVGTQQFIDEWLATPLFEHLGDRACRDQRLTNRASGMANSLRNCGTGTQLPLWDGLSAIDVPTLVIAGTDDQKFTELGHRLVDAIGDTAWFVSVRGGHAVHLENPAGTAAAISDWRGEQV